MDAIKFVWLCSSFITFLISFLLLSAYWKKEMIRLAGLYVIVPGISVLIANSLPWWISIKTQMAILAALDFLLIFIVVYFLRHLYKMRFAIPWILLAFEGLRWMWLIVFYMLGPRSVLNDFEGYLYYFYYFVPFVVLLYCVATKDKSNAPRQHSS